MGSGRSFPSMFPAGTVDEVRSGGEHSCRAGTGGPGAYYMSRCPHAGDWDHLPVGITPENRIRKRPNEGVFASHPWLTTIPGALASELILIHPTSQNKICRISYLGLSRTHWPFGVSDGRQRPPRGTAASESGLFEEDRRSVTPGGGYG